MKKIPVQIAIVFILMLTSRCLAFSQNSSEMIVYNTGVNIAKKDSRNVKTSDISIRAAKNFKKEFSQVGNEKWFFITDYLTAEFIQEGIKFRVDYNKKGKWLGTTKTYTENKLPAEIRRTIRSQYFDYNIITVTEINMPGLSDGPVYVVHIEDERSFKNVKLHNGEMTVLEEFDKD